MTDLIGELTQELADALLDRARIGPNAALNAFEITFDGRLSAGRN